MTPAGIDGAFGRLPDALGAEAEAQWAGLRAAHPPLQLGERTIRLDQPQVMGILNVTPDSFSDGGEFLDDPDEAPRARRRRCTKPGAALIDVGGESTRPGAAAVWEGDEIKRVVPAIEQLRARWAPRSASTRAGRR